MRSGAMRWVGGFSLTFGLFAALGQDACTTFGAGSEGPDASSPIQDGGPPPPPPSEAGVETAPTLVIDKTAELRRGGSVVVKLTVGGARKDEGPANLEAEFSPKLDGVTFGAMNVDVAAGTGTIEIKASATAKTAPTDLKVRAVLRGGRSTGTGVTKLDVFGKPGELDESFGVGGMVIQREPGLEVASASLDPTGNIYVGGVLRRTTESPYIAKFDSNGTSANTFGNGGSLTIPVEADTVGTVRGLHARGDGKVVASIQGSPVFPVPANIIGLIGSPARMRSFRGTDFTFTAEQNDTATGWFLYASDRLTRLTPGGWGENQGGTTGVPGAPVEVVETPTADFLVGSRFRGGEYFAVRLLKNGKMDTVFGTGGRANLGDADNMFPYGAAAGLSDMIYVCGAVGTSFRLIRFRASDGTLDSTYGTFTKEVPGLRTDALPEGCLATEDGLYAFGTSTDIDGSGWAMVLLKFNLDGTIASDFGVNGVLRQRVAPGTSFQNYGVKLMNPGNHKLLLVGYHRTPDQGNQGASIARIWR